MIVLISIYNTYVRLLFQLFFIRNKTYFIFFFVNFFIKDILIIKLVLICLLFVYIYVLRNKIYTKKVRNIEENYKLDSYFKEVYNYFIIAISILFFFLGILWLRLNNQNAKLDLKLLLQLTEIINNYSILHNIFNISRLILVLYAYLITIRYIMQSLKRHISKRYIKQIGSLKYQNLFYKVNSISILHVHNRIDFLISDLCAYIAKILKKDIYTFEKHFIYYFIKISYIVHYVLLLIVLIYDVIFNNFIISKLFYLLPYVFFYDIYLRISNFLEHLNLTYDLWLYEFLYGNDIRLISSEIISLNGEYISMEDFKLAVAYLENNLYYNYEDSFK